MNYHFLSTSQADCSVTLWNYSVNSAREIAASGFSKGVATGIC